MATERLKRHIARLLNQMEMVLGQRHWSKKYSLASDFIPRDPTNTNAPALPFDADRPRVAAPFRCRQLLLPIIDARVIVAYCLLIKEGVSRRWKPEGPVYRA